MPLTKDVTDRIRQDIENLTFELDEVRSEVSRDPLDYSAGAGELDIKKRIDRLKARLWTSPTLSQCAKIIGIRPQRWKGRCHEIAGLILRNESIPFYGVLHYGHYYGPVVKSETFTPALFQRHGWIELVDGRIFDPTRWVFECVKPYLFVNYDFDEEYDAGGNRLRREMQKPAPAIERDHKIVTIKFPSPTVARYVEDLLGPECYEARRFSRLKLSYWQCCWLGSLALSVLGDYAKPVYEGLIESGYPATIPIDNRTTIMGDANESNRGARPVARRKRVKKSRVS